MEIHFTIKIGNGEGQSHRPRRRRGSAREASFVGFLGFLIFEAPTLLPKRVGALIKTLPNTANSRVERVMEEEIGEELEENIKAYQEPVIEKEEIILEEPKSKPEPIQEETSREIVWTFTQNPENDSEMIGVEAEVVQEKKVEERKCLNCGSVLIKPRHNQKFCPSTPGKPSCKDAYHNAKKSAKNSRI